jgi:hypothetical protein
MLLNSINHALKDAFYNLEKLLSLKQVSSEDAAQHERLHALQQKGHEASLASGEFLCRARRGETFMQDKENLEIVKDYVRVKGVSTAEETQSEEETTDAAAQALTKSITDELPVFGLKASLHATADHPSFDAWKNVHHLKVEPSADDTADYLPGLNQEISDKFSVVSKLWRELSTATALRLIDHPYTPGDVLLELAHHPDTEVRAQVADNANAPLEAIMMLVKDESIDVRMSLAECYHLSTVVLEMLLEDENPYVCDRAETTLQRLNASANPSVIRTLFAKSAVEREPAVTLMRARA